MPEIFKISAEMRQIFHRCRMKILKNIFVFSCRKSLDAGKKIKRKFIPKIITDFNGFWIYFC